MCEHCGSVDRRVEITDENRADMISEASLVALHAASAYSNGWTNGARGLFEDMVATWGDEGRLRMLFVWASAQYFLPPDEEVLLNPGYSDLEKMVRENGEEPDPQHIARLVAHNDQAGACVKALAEAASTSDLAKMQEILGQLDVGAREGAVPVMLLADAGLRMAQARTVKNTTAMGLFNAHIRAHFTEDDE